MSYLAGKHMYHGRNIGRGCRENAKLMAALKGVASFELLDAVASEDAARRCSVDVQGNSYRRYKGVERDSRHFLQHLPDSQQVNKIRRST